MSYRQLDYWLRRLGTPHSGMGVPRTIPPTTLTALKAIAQANREHKQRIGHIVAGHGGGGPRVRGGG
jgi:hypothetical protein